MNNILLAFTAALLALAARRFRNDLRSVNERLDKVCGYRHLNIDEKERVEAAVERHLKRQQDATEHELMMRNMARETFLRQLSPDDIAALRTLLDDQKVRTPGRRDN